MQEINNKFQTIEDEIQKEFSKGGKRSHGKMKWG